VSTVELLVARCAGLDVAKDEVVACVRVPDGRGGRSQEVRTFPTFTSGLEALAGWLAAEGVTQVVMEATGQQLEAHLVRAGGAGLCAAVGQCPPRQDPPRPQDRCLRRCLAGRVVGAWAAAGQLRTPDPDP
jgi:transposase